MADLDMRPRFVVPVSCGSDAVLDALREGLPAAQPPIAGEFSPGHCVLSLPRGRRSLWSPELDVTFESETAGEGTRVRCLFAPRPAVWTGFFFVCAVLAAVGVVGGMYGLAQLGLGHEPWALAAPGLALVGIGIVWLASKIGQGLSAQQMYELRAFLDRGLERAQSRAASTPMDRGGL